ncbi:iron chelate uptake ABC transporter family permease subunit, partial [Erwinia billingiae]
MKNKSVFYWRTGLIILVGLLSLPLMMILAATSGEMPVNFMTSTRAITNGIGITHYDLPAVEAGIVWQYRMSRALMAASSGGGLALCGLVLQSMLRNPLADPYLLGISAGASTGAVSVMLLGLGSGAITVGVGAFSGACIAFGLVALLSGGMRENAGRI